MPERIFLFRAEGASRSLSAKMEAAAVVLALRGVRAVTAVTAVAILHGGHFPAIGAEIRFRGHRFRVLYRRNFEPPFVADLWLGDEPLVERKRIHEHNVLSTRLARLQRVDATLPTLRHPLVDAAGLTGIEWLEERFVWGGNYGRPGPPEAKPRRVLLERRQR